MSIEGSLFAQKYQWRVEKADKGSLPGCLMTQKY